ncbi:polyprenyl diphosphate synthase [Clostridium guangxiense]|uniref:polyprenyl diphosphate synthase n=1 Tax=Clostridium guangxiense TaxID=1662055 RepID=UPI001E5CB2E1|nr:polyprenyl diphosphate synthase [Clostridium guangxiense]MCD2347391.1 di-trans,poly-cis-decaprenylcistransferase [Clostridium guangxiense]
MRLPKHIGIIPDGNRRWAQSKGIPKEMGYKNGINPGFCLFKLCEKVGISEITYYGFTVDNTKRPREQRIAFTNACMNSVDVLSKENASLLVVGNRDSKMFPEKLNYYTERKQFGSGGIKVNFLVNYSWQWDLGQIINRENIDTKNIMNNIASKNVSRVDLIIRWGGRRRLSGFLPVQSAYADFYVIDDYWPDFREEHFYEALEWYDKQDITLGG